MDDWVLLPWGVPEVCKNRAHIGPRQQLREVIDSP